MKHFWIFFFVITSASIVSAQPGEPARQQEKWSLRVNPIGLIDVLDGNINAGVEYAINNQWSVTADFSYIFYSTYLSQNNGTRGYMVKPAVRYYFSEKRKFFIEATGFYKQASYKMEDWLGKDCVNNVAAYEEFQVFRFRKKVLGFNVQGGLQRSLMKNKLLRMEIYAGLGIRYKWQDIKDEPNCCFQPIQNFIQMDLFAPYYMGVSMPHGLRLVYTIQ